MVPDGQEWNFAAPFTGHLKQVMAFVCSAGQKFSRGRYGLGQLADSAVQAGTAFALCKRITWAALSTCTPSSNLRTWSAEMVAPSNALTRYALANIVRRTWLWWVKKSLGLIRHPGRIGDRHHDTHIHRVSIRGQGHQAGRHGFSPLAHSKAQS